MPKNSRRYVALAAVWVAGLAGVTVAARTDAATTPAARTISYPGTDALFANPERGFYHHTECADEPYSVSELRQLRTGRNISQVLCVFYLRGFQDRALDDDTLATLRDAFDAVRSAGLKMALRFAYTDDPEGDDASVSRVLGHIAQLKPVLRENADVLSLMQAGFVGAWGEWYYTTHFGNEGDISETDWANRKKVVDALLAALPANRTVALRTPAFKRTLYGTAPLTPERAYDGSAAARLGHHNDCFVASDSDEGTYADREVEYPYLAQETRFLPMGGETCGVSEPRSLCPTATREMGELHWSYINIDYHPDVIEGWRDGGCLTTMTRRLGYRFALRSATLPTTAARGGPLPLRLEVHNDGWASPYGPRDADLVLRNESTGAVSRIPLDTDPRRWAAGATTVLDQTLTVPANLATGRYALSLALPDPSLPDRPEYAIRLANDGLWDATTGRNNLQHTVTIG
jgi:hypothetical protein